MTDEELAGWARNWHWNDCAEDKPVDPSIYYRDMRMLKAFVKRIGPQPPKDRGHCWCGLHPSLREQCDRCMERGVFDRPADAVGSGSKS